MECNRDEALRAMDIAERKFTMKDIMGAKRFALKAQALYPDLDGITQMLVTLDVYISAERKINGVNDWYSILCVSASADEEDVKKQYRKLALLLHPDKNKFVGAEGAFKLMSEAWSVLSDRSRRMAYDQKRNIKGLSQKPPPPKSNHPVPPGSKGFNNVASNVPPGGAPVSKSSSKAAAPPTRPPKSVSDRSSRMACDEKRNIEGLSQKPPPPKSNPTVPPGSNGFNNFASNVPPGGAPVSKSSCKADAPPAYPQKSDMFWTACNSCKMHYTYLRLYLNRKLLCQNCHKPFLAVEIGAPSSVNSNPSHHHQNSYHRNASGRKTQNTGHTGYSHQPGLDPHNSQNFQRGPVSRMAGTPTTMASSAAAAQAAKVVHHTDEKVREHEEAQGAARRKEVLQKKSQSSRGRGPATGHLKAERPMKRRSFENDCTRREEALQRKCQSSRGLGPDRPKVERPMNKENSRK
ncbi:hypothetical protein QJS04_geneDACA015439 [Acorus gramineus]|uniref:J domain-containing protein n=1 Tax=Acorus gramineus TaxID=55184 RepID=A0AAV9A6N0_ACOGR|nr:hypothetical protein QJS04_geneDACA015439 [Acorus gramineus]